MADGAPAISKALEEVFGEGSVVRLMCWTHVYRNYRSRLTSVRKVSKELSQKLDMDIHNIQWMCQGQDEFVTVIKLLRDKYLSGSYSEQELDALNDFFEYFITQWCFVTDTKTGEDHVTHVHNWFEGAHPYHPSHNQGLERFNLTIKDDFSYRNQLNMGQFVSVMAEVVEASSVKDASVLDGPRHLILQKDLDGYQEKVSFKIQEEGYKYFNDNLKKLPPNVPGGPELLRPGKQLEINSVNGLDLLVTKLGMDEEVRRVIILPSTNNTLVNKSLKELAITRLQKRKSPAFSTLQEYYNIRTSCHIVEQVGRDFFCDCYHGMKGKLCCHVMGLTYARVPQFPVHPNLSAAKFRRARRPVGRPKKVGGALSKTPPRALPDFTYQVTGMEEREVQVLTLPSLATPEPGPSVTVPGPCVTDSSINVTGPSDTVTGPSDTVTGPSDTVSGPCVTDSSVNLPGPSVTVTTTNSRKRKTPSVSVPGPCVTGPSVKRKTAGNTDTQKELKCRARYGMEGKEFWCLPCTRKKKCIGTSTPVPDTREPVFDTQVSPPSKKARKTRIGL